MANQNPARRVSSSGAFASALAIAAMTLAPLPSALGQTRRPHRPPVAAPVDARTAVLRAQANWSEGMRRVARPPHGCYTARYPQLRWNQVTCGKGPDYPIVPGRAPAHPFIVGGGGANDRAARTTAITQGAEGTFVSVSGGISETGQVNNTGAAQTDAYTLQLNTEFFTSTACSTSPNAGCRGWEQFVYENNDVSHRAFIQYWLIKFNTTCPGGFNTFSFGGGSTDIYCWRNSSTVSLPADQPVSNLGNMTLSGTATAASDQVIIRAGANMASVVGLNAVAAASGWHDSEFNVFGDAGGGQANFGANTTLTVRTMTHSGTTMAPSCQSESFTGETNNLTLVGMAAIGVLPSPGIEFTQSNIPGTAAACVVANGTGDTHLRTFAGLFYDFQATGDFTLADTDDGFEAQTRQISGAPTWPDASVNEAVAARLGKVAVAICSAREPALFVDGEQRGIGDGQIIELPDGSGIKRVGNVILLVDANGNSLRAQLNGSYIDATVGLGHWPIRVQGLLASSGRAGTLLTGRDGTTLAAPYAFGALYGNYAQSWRVGGRRSMLSVCGQARESSVPRRAFYAADLPPQQARRARVVCIRQGVTDKALLDACTLDVVVIGSEKAAQVFTTLQRVNAVGLVRGQREHGGGAY